MAKQQRIHRTLSNLYRIEHPDSDEDTQEKKLLHDIKLDLQVASNDSLRDAIDQIQHQLTQRKKVLKQARHIELIKEQFRHIQEQFAADSKYVFPSLEHLELYQRYLLRLDEGLSVELEEERTGLLTKITDAISQHPLTGKPRSGDVTGDATNSGYFKIPLGRRRQMCAALLLNFFTGSALFAFFAYVLWRLMQPYSIYVFSLYLTYIFIDNLLRPMPSRRRVCQAVAALDFDPSRNYLFCYHPHGVQSVGAMACASDANKWDTIFPGISVSIQTLAINFSIPLTRELIIMMGMGNASKSSLRNVLDKKVPGSSAMLVTGGAKEAMHAHPHVSKLVLKTRRGFVRIALQTGASLVPVYGFGENNLYENLAVESQRIRYWQRRIQRIITFAPMLVAGRGVFSYSGGLVPHRRPISVVVGQPIHVDKPIAEPSDALINKVHAEYKQAVLRIFETYKEIYDPKAAPIEFI